MKITQAVKVCLPNAKELLWVNFLEGLLNGNITPVIRRGRNVLLVVLHKGTSNTPHPNSARGDPSGTWEFLVTEGTDAGTRSGRAQSS